MIVLVKFGGKRNSIKESFPYYTKKYTKLSLPQSTAESMKVLLKAWKSWEKEFCEPILRSFCIMVEDSAD